jgi:hypothetical protein
MKQNLVGEHYEIPLGERSITVILDVEADTIDCFGFKNVLSNKHLTIKDVQEMQSAINRIVEILEQHKLSKMYGGNSDGKTS